MPFGIDAERIEATYRNGVLELRVPKTEQARAKRIQVHEEGAALTAPQTHAGKVGPAATAGEKARGETTQTRKTAADGSK